MITAFIFSSFFYYNINISKEYLYTNTINEVYNIPVIVDWCKPKVKVKYVKNGNVKKKVRVTSDAQLKKIVRCAIKYSDDPFFLLAIISVESNFNPFAKSTKGATGLTQVMPLWLPELKKKYNKNFNLTKIRDSVIAGQYVIAYYIKKTGSKRKALNKYVNGSKSYCDKVLKRYNDLKNYHKKRLFFRSNNVI